ncbi:MAG: sugar phosphate nucleotidyltransferase, partial [Candidatus Hydrogenedentes bacterium]|nr:sugar phosphate nucleotidyltransferase [Candidatus Hydrogenedentota bacterium]
MAVGTRGKRVAVVMAGGSGERFWPLSRRLRPKQLLRLTGGAATMLEESVARLAPLIAPDDIYVATSRVLVEPIRAAKSGVPDENVIAEPCKRNTSGCLAYATAHILAKEDVAEDDASCGNLSMAVVTADQSIGDGDAFRATVGTVLNAAQREGALATIGIVPTRPETGYGYVRTPDDDRPLEGFSEGIRVYRVTAFQEKPDAARAAGFLASGRYLWNAGMFFWRVADFMGELDAVCPSLSVAVRAMTRAMRAGDAMEVEHVFEGLKDVSIDIALMERARKVLVARAT